MIALLYSPLFALQKRENNSNHGCCYSPFFANCKARDTKKVNKSFVPTTIIAQKKKGYVSLARDHGKGRDTTYVINFFIKKKKSWLYNYCASRNHGYTIIALLYYFLFVSRAREGTLPALCK